MNDYDVFFAQEMHRSRVAQTKENTARAARSYAFYTTTGTGEIQVPDVFRFNCTFVKEPGFLNGVSLEEETVAGDDAPDLVLTHYPRVTAGVYRWQRNVKGFYTGAWLFFVVDSTAPYSTLLTSEPKYVLKHTIAFEGLALKDLPDYLLDD